MNEKLKDWIKKQIISIETCPFKTSELGSEKIGEGQLLAYKEMLSFLENEEPEDKEFEDALAEEWKGYNDRGARGVDALEDNPMELAFSKGFYRGTIWKEKQLLSKNSIETIMQLDDLNDLVPTINDLSNKFNPGDKVKVIIIKDESTI